MARFQKNEKMTPRPDHEPKFDLKKNKFDRKIFLLVSLALFVVALLIAGIVLIYELGLWNI
ncbi:MAG: hypothetical protein WCZ47_04160 [Bacilli bacterium]|jgi:hypothetical protein|nr:hypothetical protein [Bacilli bacterium]NLN80510.1 hypothetical protein [Erysipelotrichia bacterium]